MCLRRFCELTACHRESFTVRMRIVVIGCSLLLILGIGCARGKSKRESEKFSAIPGLTDVPAKSPPPAPANPPANQSGHPSQQQVIVTPDTALVGKVKSVNPTARFVVLSFPVGHLPTPDQGFSVYRKGLKVGEIKTTNQQLNEYVVADILQGDAEEGDEVRNR